MMIVKKDGNSKCFQIWHATQKSSPLSSLLPRPPCGTTNFHLFHPRFARDGITYYIRYILFFYLLRITYEKIACFAIPTVI